MKGIEFRLTKNEHEVTVKLDPLLIEGSIEAKTLFQAFNVSPFAGYYLEEAKVFDACESLERAKAANEMSPIIATIASAKNAEVEVSINGDKMSAELTLISPFMGQMPTLKDIYTILERNEVRKGISHKRISKLIENASQAKGGLKFTRIIAKGLPPRSGKDSYIKSLYPNALERVLTPKYSADKKIDMRDYGDILCVQMHQAFARRMPPSNGRKGFTVTGDVLTAEQGKWRKIHHGKQAYIDENDENLVLAKITGLPKVNSNKIDIDDVFTTKGVNVATGNIDFQGSVIVNGDITEKMRLVASGDITIDGFVESAYVKAGGNIVVLQGASGKLQHNDCQFDAGGNVYLGHAQGVSIQAGNDLIVDKQLAYSHVRCAGNLTVGKINQPMGKLFATTIFCAKTIKAGYVGAVSGSGLLIDYSDDYNTMMEKHEKLIAHYDDLASKNADHEIKIANINNRKPGEELENKIALMTKELELERVFINWLRLNVEESKQKIDAFSAHAKVIATKKIYPGVSIKLNKKQWVAKKEYGKCKIILDGKDWAYLPL